MEVAVVSGRSEWVKAKTFRKSNILSSRVGLRSSRWVECIVRSADDLVLECLAAEVLELVGNVAGDNKKMWINPKHFNLAVCNDEELDSLSVGVAIARGGVLSNIQAILLLRTTFENADYALMTISDARALQVCAEQASMVSIPEWGWNFRGLLCVDGKMGSTLSAVYSASNDGRRPVGA
uniref:Histone H2A n=1 Tax=Parascaris univalens TaxID=6257 RepID=A0A915ASE6_PARUN